MTEKIHETHFDEYITSSEQMNLHPNLQSTVYTNLPDNIINLPNIILYGPKGVGKYTQALLLLKRYSSSLLKYEKKIIVESNKLTYSYKVSDIHIEIDMSLLGCNAKLLWNDIYTHLIDIAHVKEHYMFIIMCKNYQDIHSELLDHFYSYMQTPFYKLVKITFLILTEHISFIPNNIINICKVISVARPSEDIYTKCFGTLNRDITSIHNIKSIKSGIIEIPSHVQSCNKLIDVIVNYEDSTFFNIRELCYNILVYDLDVYECVWYIINNLIKTNHLDISSTRSVYIQTVIFLRYYNNNYRPIYHLENYILFIIRQIHKI
jgi:hypothetical protein